MMRELFLLLYILLTLTATAQQSLTQINGWNAYVHLPWDYNQTTNPYRTLIFFPGIGEVGTNASAVIANGPGAYIAQGWNGNVWTGNDTAKFIVISLQTPTAYPPESEMDIRIETIKSLYRVDTTRLYLTGLSHGGWCATTYITGDPYGGYYYAKKVAAVVNVEGVQPSDNQPYPNLFDNYANVGGRLACFEQSQDFRDMQTYVNRMNSIVPNSAIYTQTNFGGGGHCCWNQFYGGQGVTPQNFLLDGVSQNIYQWMAKQRINTLILSLDTTTWTPPRPDYSRKFFYNENKLYLRNLGSDILRVFDMHGKQLYTLNVLNSTTLDLSRLPSGLYIARFNQKTLKFIK